jgi:hypothetical protein
MSKTPRLYDAETDTSEDLPFKWEICGGCSGHGKSSSYLGAFTGEQMAEDPDFARDYMAGFYDRACDCCGGSGKTKAADPDRMTERQLAAWEAQCQAEAEYQAEKYSERFMDPEYLADLRSGY